MNTTNIVFTSEEEDLLSKGLKHCLPPLNVEAAKANIVADLAVRIGPGWNIQQKVSDAIKNMHIPSMCRADRSILKSLRNKINSHHLVVSKADKGNAVVIMEQQMYHSKFVRVIEDMGGGTFNFDANVAEVRKVISECGHILKTLPLKNALLVMNPGSPMLYGPSKVHKPGMPIWPVVSYVFD